MIRVGIAGIGFMGVTHFQAYRQVKGAKVAAIFTRDARKLRGDWRAVRGNFGPSGGQQDLRRIRPYGILEELIADPDIDLLDICLPTEMHPPASIQAMQAGKHVLCEKPVATRRADARRMLRVARQTGRLFMVAQVLRFFPEFAYLKKCRSSGRYGPLLALHLKRVISPPTWWSSEDIKRTGGAAIDLHIHDSDFVQYLLGMPDRVSTSAIFRQDGSLDYAVTNYLFDDQPVVVSCQTGWINQPSLVFEHGYDAYFERATIQFNSTSNQQVTVYGPRGKPRKRDFAGLAALGGFVGELAEAVKAARTGTASAIISGESGFDSLRICLAEIESAKRQGALVAVK